MTANARALPAGLHPQAREFLEKAAAADVAPVYAISPADARARSANARPLIGPEVGSVHEETVPVRVRVYEPLERALGTIVYLHGGGWVLGTLDAVDAVCRRLTVESGCEVVSVDYRLAPEHPFPAAVDDAWAALGWAARRPSATAGVVLVGDSAGGNLAAACALRARDRGGPEIAAQILIHPVLDHDFTRASYREHGDAGLIVGQRELEYFWDQYAPGALRRDPEASPLLAPDLSRLPPTVLLVAGFDPVRDECLAYAERLDAASVPVVVERFDDMPHALLTMVTVFERADQAVALIGQAARRAGTARLPPETPETAP